jgi:hypothetical protein
MNGKTLKFFVMLSSQVYDVYISLLSFICHNLFGIWLNVMGLNLLFLD